MNTSHSTEREGDGGIVERVVGEQLYDTLFARADRVGILLEPDGRVVDANRTALALGDLDREAVVGEDVWETPWFAENRQTVRADVRCAATGSPVSGDRELRTADGVALLDATVQPIAPAGEEVAFLLFTGVDVTDRDRRIERLERRVERLEEFARVVSHDLRTPLCVADANLALATERVELPELARAGRALDRVGQLLSDVRTVASRGHAVEERTTVGLGTVAREAWEHVVTGDATLAVESTTHLLADESRLLQVFENLFENAVEHSSTSPRSQAPEDAVELCSTNRQPQADNAVEHAGPAVTVRVGATDGGFYVADDGPGLPENAFGSVFEAGVTTSSDGTGFGLTIVESIVLAHGWTIAAGESADGGARFDVRTDPDDSTSKVARDGEDAVPPL